MKWIVEGHEVLIDEEDYNRALRFYPTWTLHKNYNGDLYVKCTRGIKLIYLHRFILKVWKKRFSHLDVDHRNMNTLDNHKSNLRLATKSETKMNQGLRVDNTSGTKGVFWQENGKLWRIRITIDGKRFNKSSYDKEEAIKIADSLRNELHGEFARKSR